MKSTISFNTDYAQTF